MTLEQIVAAVMDLPDAQRVAVANAAIAGVKDDACALPLNRLSRHAGTIGQELVRERFLRDCG